jgi:Sap, sulfolipid-1-addressing protein
MNLDVIVLALASAPRPSGVAAVYALLSASPPRRVVVAYLAAGLAFSVGFGVAVVAIFHGAGLGYRDSTAYAAIELLGGVAALGFAAGFASGRRQLPNRNQHAGEESAIARRLRHPTMATASVAGVATHLPGLFYLLALNAIVAEHESLGFSIVEVVAFNAIWFATTFVAVAVFLLRPGAARRALARVDAWARRHARTITTLAFAVAGAYLTIKGLVDLLD